MGRLRHYAGLAYRKARPKVPEEVLWPVGQPARDYPEYSIGAHTYGAKIRIRHDAIEHTLRIGDYCSLAEDTTFWVGGGHRTEWVTTYPFNALYRRFHDIEGHPVSRGDITVGNDVWTGFESLIMSGVTIGDGAVIGARSVVTRDVPAYTIVGGVPAKVIRPRFDDATIARLQEIAWWEWDEESVMAAVPLLQNDDIAAFIAEVDAGRLPLPSAVRNASVN